MIDANAKKKLVCFAIEHFGCYLFVINIFPYMNFPFFPHAYQTHSIILHTVQMCRNPSPLHKDLALYCNILGHMVVQLVGALHCKGHDFNSQ